MAALGQTFDPSTVKDNDVLPEKTNMLAQIINSDLKATKSGTGQIIVLTWEIMGGPYAKRQVFQNINYRNDNPTAENIGQRELKKICDAVGVGVISNTNELHMRPCIVRFKTEKSDGFPDKSVPAAYERWAHAQSVGPTTHVTPDPNANRLPPAQQQPAAAWSPPPAQVAPPAGADKPWG